MDYCKHFKNKNITLMGLGLLGRGVGDARFLAECGANLTVTDLKSEEQLADSLKTLKDFKNINFVLGEHRTEDFVNADMVIKAPATPLNSPYIKAAKDAGVHVTMSTALFAKHAMYTGAVIVGVTGTRGKSTITHMIYHTLSLSNPITKSVHLGGNIRGVSTLAMLPEMEKADPSSGDGAEASIAVLELDSWQLQGFGEEHISPNVAVFANLMPDHLNYYANEDEYFADKANIFKFQNAQKGDTLIVGDDIAEKIRQTDPPIEPIISVPIPEEWKLQVLGVHNRENAALAREALAALGVPDDDIRTGLESFTGVEGRLEFLRDTNLPRVAGGKAGEVKIYNDNNATTPQATIAALKSFPSGRVVLIAGGTDKGIALDELAKEIKERTKALILIDPSVTGTQTLAQLFPDAPVCKSVKDALAAARAAASAGDTILFSPAFSSFGMFKNEYDRNDQFKGAVEAL
ncbi:MAG: Mur ligase family protein [bacterium]|nr:Mur ligase family protein [bacterium]